MVSQEETAVEQEAQEQTQAKDTLIFVKSKSLGEDSKGRTKIDLRFSEEETAQVREELAKIGARLKLQLHISDDTAFIFIKEVQPMSEVYAKKAGKPAGGGGFKQKGVSSSTAAKIAGLKGK